jgi:2-oxoglutarate ferredoxin oxidoreductase subunit alpha
MFGRNGESPLPIIAASSPADCFAAAMEACAVALKYMVPVILLSDGYVANGSEPWRLPEVADLPDLGVSFRTDPQGFTPYLRDPETLARVWAIPGTAGLEHRIGGLEKQDVTGNISYDPSNHEQMTHLRANKVAGVARSLPPLVVDGEPQGELLVLGWGGTEGALIGGVQQARERGMKVSRAHLRWLNPLPNDLGDVLSRFRHVLVPELNMGQLALLLRARYLKDVTSYTKVQGKPFFRQEILQRITSLLEGTHDH